MSDFVLPGMTGKAYRAFKEQAIDCFRKWDFLCDGSAKKSVGKRFSANMRALDVDTSKYFKEGKLSEQNWQKTAELGYRAGYGTFHGAHNAP